MRRTTLAAAIACGLCGWFAAASAAHAQEQATTDATEQASSLSTITVTGSRIPRAQVEGPAPITVMTAADIKASGLMSVPDVLRAMTQNGGETQSQQSASGADFSPGAQQVDLRGLGPECRPSGPWTTIRPDSPPR